MKKILFITCVFLGILLLFTGCSEFIYQKDDFSTGKKLSSEDLESIKMKVQETTAPSYETDINGETIVFWTDGGTVYHNHRNCSSLSKSKVVESGSVDDAIAAGKAKSCLICGIEKADTE